MLEIISEIWWHVIAPIVGLGLVFAISFFLRWKRGTTVDKSQNG